MQHIMSGGELYNQSYFIKKQSQCHHSVQEKKKKIQEIMLQVDNPQRRTRSRTKKTHTNGNQVLPGLKQDRQVRNRQGRNQEVRIKLENGA